jgi:ABC-2 type transport system permease protein
MRKVWYIVLHNLRLLASDRSAFFWLLVMPIAFTFVMGLAFGNRGGGGGDAPVRYALTLANLDEGEEGAALVRAIEEAGEIDILLVEEANADSVAAALVEDGDRSAALVIPPDYSTKLARGESATLTFHRNPERMNPLVTRQAVARVIARKNVEILAARGVAEGYAELRGEPSDAKAEELRALVEEYVAGAWEPAPVTVAEERLGRPTESELPEGGFSHSSPSMALMFVLLNGLMMSSVLVTERRERTLARLFAAPIRRSEIIAAQVGWRFIVGMGQFWILIAVGAFAFRVDWGDTMLGLLLLTVVYVAAVAGLSVLVGSVSRTSRQAESFSLVLALTMCALGGLWWPLEITPRAYQAVGHAIPTAWAMDAMHDLLSRGYGLAGIAHELLVLLAFAAGFSIVAVATFRHE